MTPNPKTVEQIKKDLFRGNFQDIHFKGNHCIWKKPGEDSPANYQFQFEEHQSGVFLHLKNKEHDIDVEYRIFIQELREAGNQKIYWLLSDDDSFILCPRN
ncbi:MAG: hypothetical protein ACHQD9_01325 [Chitinophagales bacterium]